MSGPPTMNAETLADLIARVEKLEGPDRVADKWLAALYGPSGGPRAPYYTASLDAALALVERVLPDWRWSLFSWSADPNGPFVACMACDEPVTMSVSSDGRRSPAVALILALLHALEANADGENASRDHAPSDDGGASVANAPLQLGEGR